MRSVPSDRRTSRRRSRIPRADNGRWCPTSRPSAGRPRSRQRGRTQFRIGTTHRREPSAVMVDDRGLMDRSGRRSEPRPESGCGTGTSRTLWSALSQVSALWIAATSLSRSTRSSESMKRRMERSPGEHRRFAWACLGLGRRDDRTLGPGGLQPWSSNTRRNALTSPTRSGSVTMVQRTGVRSSAR